MTQEQIDSRTQKIRDYYANEDPQKKAERIERIREYHRTIHRKQATANRARMARKDIERTIATLQYIIGQTNTPPSDTPTDNNE